MPLDLKALATSLPVAFATIQRLAPMAKWVNIDIPPIPASHIDILQKLLLSLENVHAWNGNAEQAMAIVSSIKELLQQLKAS